MNDRCAFLFRALGGLLALACIASCAAPTVASRDRWTEPATGMVFVKVPAGSFLMGSPSDEPNRETQERQHRVTLTRAFWLGAFEVTQAEWRAVMNEAPSWFAEGSDRRPVENVTFFDVQTFLQRLSARSTGNHFRLPSEAEWEYACRAGTTTAFSTGAELTHEAANFAVSAERAAAGEGTTQPVGSYPANAWGLHDMHGNVWEWTSDEHCPYADGDAVDPMLSCGAPLKVIRGGSWYFGADSARCALRYTHRPGDRGFSLGFRVVREG